MIRENNLNPLSMTVVSCIESGVLEPQTLRMVDSLRRFGGRFADLDVVAVTPRASAPLAADTVRRMAELNIRHLQVRPKNPYSWHHYTNKAEAVAAVEREVTTDALAWIDSDIIFLKEPGHLELTPSDDFLANATDIGVIGSTGPNSEHDPFWRRCAALIGKDVDELPWIETSDGIRIRFYWNAGLFVYRRTTELGSKFVTDLRLFLDRRVCRTHSQLHGLDQVVLGLSVLRNGLRWRPIPNSSNYSVCSTLRDCYKADSLIGVSVLHYHDSMEPQRWNLLLQTLGPTHGDVVAWLKPQGPVLIPSSAPTRIAGQALRAARGFKRRLYYSKSGYTKSTRVETTANPHRS